MLTAVRAVAAGGSYVDSGVRRLIAAAGDGARAQDRVLSVREREVLARLADGRSVEEIAADLVLSPETIRTHARNAIRKLGTRTRAHAIVVALRRGELAL
jgi:DNA-binding NarL/FixJ family response regulator